MVGTKVTVIAGGAKVIEVCTKATDIQKLLWQLQKQLQFTKTVIAVGAEVSHGYFYTNHNYFCISGTFAPT